MSPDERAVDRDRPPAAGGYEYSIEVVENAARTLLMLADRPTVRAADVAAALGVGRSTAHRMVLTLVQCGLLHRNEDKSYRAGPELLRLSAALMGGSAFRDAVGPALHRLVTATGETAHFLERDGQNVVFIDGEESPRLIRAGSRVGAAAPAHVTSAGRALLALMPEAEVRALYPDDDLPPGGTDQALHTRDELLADLRRVAEEGYAVNLSESEPGLIAVARAVRDARGNVYGAFSVSGPADRMSGRTAEIAAHLRREVDALIERVEAAAG